MIDTYNLFQIQSDEQRYLTMQGIKLKYFPCRKGGEHEGEVLNYICMEQCCKQKGLICSICKLKHQGHQAMPLKMLLQSLKGYKEKPMENQSFQQSLQRLEQHRNLVLFQLKRCVQAIAEKFRKIQEQICEDFTKVKVELLEKVQLNMKFNQIIETALNNEYDEEESFTNDFHHIASMIKKEGQGSKITYSLNLDEITSRYQKKQKSLRNLFINTQKIIDKQLLLKKQNPVIQLIQNSERSQEEQFMLGDFFDDGFQNNLNAKIPKVISQTNSSVYTFSPTFKSSSIMLSNGNKKARQNATVSTRFVLVDQNVGIKNQKIAFKIIGLKNWVGVGIGLKNNLKNANYHFNYNNNGHGSYLVSSNSFNWSHSHSDQNIKNNSFPFMINDIIDVSLSPNSLNFRRRKDNKSTSLKIKLTQIQWKNVCFCANLCNQGDQIQIVDPL